VSEAIEWRGFPLVPGDYAHLFLGGVDRPLVELLLASWFAWLGDRAAITLAPAGGAQAVELRIRRWKTRPDLVLFRWRNADATRASFGRVRERFEAERQAVEIELTPKTMQPRAMVIELAAADVFSPAAAVGLAKRAFAAAGLPDAGRYDLTCTGHVLEQGTLPRRLIPPSGVFQAGRSVGRILGTGRRWAMRAMQWVRGDE
jgi:hypothetical protein